MDVVHPGVGMTLLQLDELVGRKVRAAGNRCIGRIEEFRADYANGHCKITEYVIGEAGLFERLGLGVRLLLGRQRDGYLVRWDQLDLSDPERPRLTCSVGELRRLSSS